MVVTDYNEQFLDKRGTDHLIDELKAYIDSIATGNIDLSDYVTKEELQAKLDALDINIDLSSYATKEELTQAINSIDLSAYAKKTDIPSLDGYALKTEIPNKVSQLENDNNYLTSIPKEYVTETELNAKGYLTEHQDLSSYALKTEIPSLDGYATTEYVDNAIANVPSGGTVDLSNYYTKAETNALIPSTDGLATTEYVDNAISNIPATDLSNYYTKNETYSKTEVNTLVANSGGSGGGSSSGGITYAFNTEIATGDTWVDGKPIYMRVLDFTNVKPSSSSGFNLRMIRYDGWLINEVIDSRIALRNGVANYASSQISAKISGTNLTRVVDDINSKIVTRDINYTIISADTYTTIQVFIGVNYDNKTQKIYLTVKYTKP